MKSLIYPTVLKSVAVTMVALWAVHNMRALDGARRFLNFDQKGVAVPKTTRKLPSFEGVVAGQTATLRCPIGHTYHQMLVTYFCATWAQ